MKQIQRTDLSEWEHLTFASSGAAANDNSTFPAKPNQYGTWPNL